MMQRYVVVKRLAVLTSSVVLAVSLTACVTRGPGIDAGCRLFNPIASSVADTVPTRRQVVAHNAVGEAACGWRRNR